MLLSKQAGIRLSINSGASPGAAAAIRASTSWPARPTVQDLYSVQPVVRYTHMAQDLQSKATFATNPVAGSKRKRDAPKFYAVRIGKRPGIYDTWNECQSQVTGYKNAQYKSFSTRSEAQDFIMAKDTLSASSVGKVKKWYAVQAGRNPGVYPSWLAIQDEITNFKGAKYKSFGTKAEAEAFVNAPHVDDAPDDNAAAKKAKIKAKTGPAPVPSMIDHANYTPGEAPLPAETEDGFDNAVILDEQTGKPRYRTKDELSQSKPVVSRPSEDSVVHIWTDGATPGNGREGAFAGIGVHFGPGDKRNLSEGLSGSRQTNQRAELTAIIRALELAPKDRKIVINSDSNYSIKCVTEWYVNWRRRNWHNSQGKPVENKDLVQRILDLLEERQRINKHRTWDTTKDSAKDGPWAAGPAGVRFQWVKGHANDAGNIAADKLATDGAVKAKEMYLLTAHDDDDAI